MSEPIWKFKLDRSKSFDLYDHVGHVKDGIIMEGDLPVGFILRDRLYIFAGYDWNGCNPKRRIFGKIVGTPDFKKTINASLAHDFLIEYYWQHNLNRKKIDDVFEGILKLDGFKLWWLYSSVVHAFRFISSVTPITRREYRKKRKPRS
ncbi:hypothetical protein N9955_00330 [bacterium]|nr:hypothetical protein [bacterium]